MNFPAKGDNFRTLKKYPKVTARRTRAETNARVEGHRLVSISLPAPRDPELLASLFPDIPPEDEVAPAAPEKPKPYSAAEGQAIILKWLQSHGREMSTVEILHDAGFCEAYGKRITRSGLYDHLVVLRNRGDVTCDMRMERPYAAAGNVRTSFWIAAK